MANNQNVNKVVYAGTTLIDLTGDDVTAGDVLSGKKFHLPSGAEATGTLQVVNRNLLDNWYFVSGGSQLGDGVFPINQRGQTVYSGTNIYTIDRWRTTGAQKSIEVSSDGLSLAHAGLTSNNSFFVQDLTQQIDTNATKTLSILDSDGNLYTKSGKSIWVTNAPFGGYRIEDNRAVNILVAEGKSIKIIAVKLELGSEQTLAHNEGTEENPVWVLNEIPDYGEELRKCQRYYQLFRTASLRPTYGEDCRPTMATEQPTKGTLTKDGVTYYTLSSEP